MDFHAFFIELSPNIKSESIAKKWDYVKFDFDKLKILFRQHKNDSWKFNGIRVNYWAWLLFQSRCHDTKNWLSTDSSFKYQSNLIQRDINISKHNRAKTWKKNKKTLTLLLCNELLRIFWGFYQRTIALPIIYCITIIFLSWYFYTHAQDGKKGFAIPFCANLQSR